MKINRKIKTQLAKIAYIQNKSEMVAAINAIYPMAEVIPIYVPRTDTECFAFRVGTTFVFGASGTESFKDLWIDAKCHLSSYEYGGRVHTGFQDVFESIKEKLQDAFVSLFEFGCLDNFVFLGHSLGAEIAMGASDIISQYMAPFFYNEQIITWGCPNGWSNTAREGFEFRHPNVLHVQNPMDYVTWMQGITTGRPWDGHRDKFLKLSGKWGHRLGTYIANSGD